MSPDLPAAYTSAASKLGEIVLISPFDGEPWHLPLWKDRNRVSISNIGTYPPKNVIADYTRASHQILSSFTVSELSGGMLVRDQQEATDISRYWFGTMQTRWPRQFTNARKPVAIDGPGAAVPLGDRGTAETLVAFGTALHKLLPPAATVEVGELPAPPQAGGSDDWAGEGSTVYLFIPLGSAGYARWDGASVVHDDDLPVVAFRRLDTAIYALTTDGRLMQSVDAGATWVLKARVDRSETPRALIDFWDAQNRPALHIVTDCGVYGVVLEDERAYRIKGSPPRHPFAGFGACEFRADLYVSYGMGVNKYSGGDFLPMGLDGRNGLPAEYRGNILALVDGYNAMYCLVQGESTEGDGETETETFVSDASRHAPGFASTSGLQQIHAWDGIGWSPVWLGEPGASVRGLVMGQAGGYRLLWGCGDRVLTLPTASDFFNPLERYDAGPYEASSFLRTATTDFNTPGQNKLLYGVELITRNLADGRAVEVRYQVDDGPWALLGVLEEDNAGKPQLLRFGRNGTFPGTVQPRYDGLAGDRITLELVGLTPDEQQTPIVESYGFVYHALMGVLDSFTVTVDCGQEIDEYNGRTGPERVRFIDSLLPGDRLVPLLHQGEWRSVRVVGSSGEDSTGNTLQCVRRVAMVEVG